MANDNKNTENIVDMKNDIAYKRKYALLLEVLNKILANSKGADYVPITEIDQFQNIPREYLISEVNSNYMKEDEIYRRICAVFNANSYYNKRSLQEPALAFVKKMAVDVNHKFVIARINNSTIVDGKKHRFELIEYSIKKQNM